MKNPYFVAQKKGIKGMWQQGLRDNIKFGCKIEKGKSSLAWKNLMQKLFVHEEKWALKLGGAIEKSPMQYGLLISYLNPNQITYGLAHIK